MQKIYFKDEDIIMSKLANNNRVINGIDVLPFEQITNLQEFNKDQIEAINTVYNEYKQKKIAKDKQNIIDHDGQKGVDLKIFQFGKKPKKRQSKSKTIKKPKNKTNKKSKSKSKI